MEGMLVLTRKRGEDIVINGNITVRVVEVRGDKVRVGVIAPRDIPVHRKEVFDNIERQKAKETLTNHSTPL